MPYELESPLNAAATAAAGYFSGRNSAEEERYKREQEALQQALAMEQLRLQQQQETFQEQLYAPPTGKKMVHPAKAGRYVTRPGIAPQGVAGGPRARVPSTRKYYPGYGAKYEADPSTAGIEYQKAQAQIAEQQALSQMNLSRVPLNAAEAYWYKTRPAIEMKKAIDDAQYKVAMAQAALERAAKSGSRSVMSTAAERLALAQKEFEFRVASFNAAQTNAYQRGVTGIAERDYLAGYSGGDVPYGGPVGPQPVTPQAPVIIMMTPNGPVAVQAPANSTNQTQGDWIKLSTADGAVYWKNTKTGAFSETDPTKSAQAPAENRYTHWHKMKFTPPTGQ